ncbi:MAG TPA: carbohydrate kinase family protein [Streptosporangiaceae bacterium]|jgi:sulfofructose kinase
MSPRPPDAVFVGVAMWDTVARLPRFPDPDGRVVAEEMRTAGGGPASTAAVAAARLGLPSALVAAVGDDREAGLIADALRAEGVAADLRTVPGRASGSCVVLVDRARGSRAICVLPGPDLEIPPDSPTAARIRSARWLHVDHAGLPAVRPLLSALAPGTPRPTVSYDAGNLRPQRRPPEVDVYVPTVAALRDLYGPAAAPGAATVGDPADPATTVDQAVPADIADLLAAARGDGASVVAATDGAHGAYAAGPEGAYAVAGHTGIDVRSTLGAGDVFHGALVAALAGGMPLPAALAYANAAAALSCRGLDGRGGIPDDAETRALAARRPATSLTPDQPRTKRGEP